jgi:hypothetical protein
MIAKRCKGGLRDRRSLWGWTMAFVDLELEGAYSKMESMGMGDAREAASVGQGKPRSRLIAVAILADMEKKGRTLAVVTRPYAFEHPILKDQRIEIPEGFVTDFASIPRFLWFMVPPFGRHAPAAVIHDFLYASGQSGARKYADFLFREAMKELGVPLLRRSMMYMAVRLGGQGGYGLEGDWTFIDHRYGNRLPEFPEKPSFAFLGWQTWKRIRRKRKRLSKAKGKAQAKATAASQS